MAIDIKLLTIEDLAGLDDDGSSYELLEGELVRMGPPGIQHAGIVLNIGGEMREFARNRKLGRVITNGGFLLQRDPDTLLSPDIAFIRADQMTSGLETVPGYAEFVPDVVVEVVSTSDSASHMQEKLEKYLGCGVKVVAIVWPRTKMITVHDLNGLYGTFHFHEQFHFGEVFPGFQMPVSGVFE